MSARFIAQVDRFAKARRESRAAFIRRACEHFIEELREQELEAAYERGYREHPEELEFAEAAARLAAETWPSEDWSEEAASKPKQG
jgi:predicted transcriptional regulator